ncbi:hypothetical protein [Desulfobulbus alkaliphilus]|uniref:hypothetical protein n=1 Tax=Desulfobulbus alkaliphilus TaxID=869814 RepID=UPI00196680E0|nr:hypothetical protein [Desulfobulbus alkaliphilus]MBM9535455.1 hypothetical protein [Desulfobulbus alkaliphilus]
MTTQDLASSVMTGFFGVMSVPDFTLIAGMARTCTTTEPVGAGHARDFIQWEGKQGK